MTTYEGSIELKLANEQKIEAGKSYSYFFPNDLMNQTFNWKDSNKVPSEIQSTILSVFLSNQSFYRPVFTFQINLHATSTGITTTPERSRFNFGIFLSTCQLYKSFVLDAVTYDQNQNPVLTYDYLPPKNQIIVTPADYNNYVFSTTAFPDSLGIYINRPGGLNNDFIINQLDFVIDMKISLDCTSNNLERNLCKQYCNENSSNLNSCLPSYLDYCFKSNLDFADNSNCTGFFANYISINGSTNGIDTVLNNYCSKYTTFNQFQTETRGQITRDICACHLPTKLYSNYLQQLEKQIPGLSKVPGINQYCLYPICSSSPFKNVWTGKQCKLPKCINSVTFGPNGDVTNVIIDQNSACANIGGGGNNNIRYIFYIFIVIIILIIMLLPLFK